MQTDSTWRTGAGTNPIEQSFIIRYSIDGDLNAVGWDEGS